MKCWIWVFYCASVLGAAPADFPIVAEDLQVKLFAREPLVRNPCVVTASARKLQVRYASEPNASTKKRLVRKPPKAPILEENIAAGMSAEEASDNALYASQPQQSDPTKS